MSHSIKIGVVAVLWTNATALGIVGTIEVDLRLMFWGLFVALAALAATGYLATAAAVRDERLRIEHLVDGLMARARERANADVPRVH